MKISAEDKKEDNWNKSKHSKNINIGMEKLKQYKDLGNSISDYMDYEKI